MRSARRAALAGLARAVEGPPGPGPGLGRACTARLLLPPGGAARPEPRGTRRRGEAGAGGRRGRWGGRPGGEGSRAGAGGAGPPR